MHERLRRPSRPRTWHRPGAPSEKGHLQARWIWRQRWALRVVALVLVVLIFALAYSANRLAPFSENRDAYASVAEHVRSMKVRKHESTWKDLTSWSISSGGMLTETRVKVEALGIRTVHVDEETNALLLRPGGVLMEEAYAHVPFGLDPGQAPAFSRRAQPVEAWQPLGGGWYRVRGRW